ncbi:uncharacterized protein J8A68_005619 [[Candida] subhashii]|uniref:Uncharacterized protein n=1 Tax=[Candida] subhashii TaxID=561895 RepID=A0A8J5Q2S4_9ASCO|nr:uncharacterized protein J8A68_005619 [[Candida] subhashii]KAG7660944.1 hypothetical protein J8A68_005619 [[Candida] subhashii]
MSESEVAPYGGYLVKTLDEEKEREELLKQQSIDINVNGHPEIIRPEALHLQGVDSLSTDDIKSYIDYYLNYSHVVDDTDDEGIHKVVYQQLPIDEQLIYKVEWINDSSVNIRFQTHKDCSKALKGLSIIPSNPNIETSEKQLESLDDHTYVSSIIQQREGKPYNPIIRFRKQQNLLNRLGLEAEQAKEQFESGDMEEDESSVVIYLRQAFQSDRKVKNASQYSRYYLIHGEPERKPYKPRHKRRDRPSSNRQNQSKEQHEENDDQDLFAGRLAQVGSRRSRESSSQPTDDDDLFAHKMKNRERSRSPMRIDNDHNDTYRER